MGCTHLTLISPHPLFKKSFLTLGAIFWNLQYAARWLRGLSISQQKAPGSDLFRS